MPNPAVERDSQKAAPFWFPPRYALVRLGFAERIRGSHRIFSREGVVEIINLQPKGNKAKTYQVIQVRNILVSYRLGESDVD